jgi:Tfp pilus assembly protein PilO
LKRLIRERDAIRDEIGRLELSVAQTAAIEGQLNDSKQKLIRLEEKLEVLKGILPAQQETSEVLRSVQQMAASSNLRINKFSPRPAVPQELYSDWPIQITVEGNYDGLGLFFEKVSRAARIINIGSLSIKGSEKNANPVLTLTASCTATTFVFREEPFDSPVPVSDEAEDTKPYPGIRAGRPERVAESPETNAYVRYLDDGRRDPFLNPLFMKENSGARDEEEVPSRRPAGITGTYIAELLFEGTCFAGGWPSCAVPTGAPISWRKGIAFMTAI